MGCIILKYHLLQVKKTFVGLLWSADDLDSSEDSPGQIRAVFRWVRSVPRMGGPGVRAQGKLGAQNDLILSFRACAGSPRSVWSGERRRRTGL